MLHFIVFCFTFWFGAYLLAHDVRKPPLLWTGLGLIAYAVVLALDAYAGSQTSPDPLLVQTRWLIVLLPGLCWAAALISLFRPGTDQPPRSTRAIVGVATLFFALGIGLLVLPLNLLPASVVILAIGGDMAMLGYAVIRYDAFEEGQQFAPAALRSLLGAAAIALLVGGQSALIARVSDIAANALTLLAFSLTGTMILLFAFAGAFSGVLDRLAFSRQPAVQHERAELRAAEQSAALRGAFDWSAISDADFARLTRRAISALGDLKRLSSSPLIDLPIIAERIHRRGASDNTLERASELRALLIEQIDRLKPRDGDGSAFNASDSWRYYNALHFVYVVGLRPYSLRADHDLLDPSSRAALEWFQTQVPERTLHNWQNAAAALIADDLRKGSLHLERL